MVKFFAHLSAMANLLHLELIVSELVSIAVLGDSVPILPPMPSLRTLEICGEFDSDDILVHFPPLEQLFPSLEWIKVSVDSSHLYDQDNQPDLACLKNFLDRLIGRCANLRVKMLFLVYAKFVEPATSKTDDDDESTSEQGGYYHQLKLVYDNVNGDLDQAEGKGLIEESFNDDEE